MKKLLIILLLAYSQILAAQSGFPSYPANTYQSFAENKTATTVQTIYKDAIYAGLYWIKASCTVDTIKINLGTANTGMAVVGYWRYDPLSGWTKVGQTDPFSCNFTGYREFATNLQVNMPPGIYAIGICCSEITEMLSIGAEGIINYFGYTPAFPSYVAAGTLMFPYNMTLPNNPDFSRAALLHVPFILSKIE